MSLNSAQQKKLKSILDLALNIEKESHDGLFPANQLQGLIQKLNELKSEQTFELQKISQIPQHLSKDMTVRHFSHLFIPVERLIDRALRDDDFLTTSNDRTGKEKIHRPIYFVLDNVRSAFNVGSIFRLADGVGATEILLSGYTPRQNHEAVLKTSLSSTQFVNSLNFEHVSEALQHLKKKSVRIVALETVKESRSLFELPLQGPIAFLVGNERFGLDYSLLKNVDEIRHIPMYGVKNSLNVAQALSVAAFEWSRQNP